MGELEPMKYLLLAVILTFTTPALPAELLSELWWAAPQKFGPDLENDVAGHNIYCMQLGVDTAWIPKLAGIAAPATSVQLVNLNLTAGKWDCIIKAYNALGAEENHYLDIVSFDVIISGVDIYFTQPPKSFESMGVR